jgi:hypothetical protein
MNMNKPTLYIISAFFLCAMSIGFASPTPTPTPPKTPRKPAKIDESDKPPFIGMTKAQAIARYGKPKKHTLTDEGEQWLYILNYGEVLGKAFIPFNFHHTPLRTGVLIFSPAGKVKKFNWDIPTD